MTSVTDIVGTVQDENLISYTLLIAPFGSNEFVELAQGTANVSNDVLGQIDPTLLATTTTCCGWRPWTPGATCPVLIKGVGRWEHESGELPADLPRREGGCGGNPDRHARTYDSLLPTLQAISDTAGP